MEAPRWRSFGDGIWFFDGFITDMFHIGNIAHDKKLRYNHMTKTVQSKKPTGFNGVNAVPSTTERASIISTDNERGVLVHLYLLISISMLGVVPAKVHVHIELYTNSQK